MIFHEAHHSTLIAAGSQQMIADAVDAVVFQAVIQALIVGVVEAERLQFGLHLPVDFGHKHEVAVLLFDRRDYILPIFRSRQFDAFGPQIAEHTVDKQHRHIAADAVALLGDGLDSRQRLFTPFLRKGVDLCGIRPGRKVRIATMREDQIIFGHAKVKCGTRCEFVF